MEERLKHLEQKIDAILQRNARVEADKKWETSLFRMFFLALITYLVAVFLLYLIGATRTLLGALVPAAGFILSVQTLPAPKRWWVRKFLQP